MKKFIDILGNTWAVDFLKICFGTTRSTIATVVIAALGTFGYVKGSGNTKKADCSSCEAERSKLVDFLIDIRRDMEEPGPIKTTAFYFSSDTTKPIKKDSVINRIKQRLDSAILKNKKSFS